MTTTDSGGAAGGLPDDIEARIAEYAVKSIAVYNDLPDATERATAAENALRESILRFADDRAAEARRKAVEEAASVVDKQSRDIEAYANAHLPAGAERTDLYERATAMLNAGYAILSLIPTHGASDGR